MSIDVFDPVSFITGIFDDERGGKNDPFQLAAGPFLANELRVLSFHGRERVNDVYTYDVVFATQQPAEALHAAVFGDPACLTIKAPGHEPRVIQGIASSLEALGSVPGERGSRRRRYRIEIVPKLWLLKYRRQNRVFQHKTPKEIIEEVLAGAKIAPEECWWRIRTKDYPKLPFVYQRGESDYEFLRRVLSDAGIFFYFEHASGLLDTLLPGAGAVAGAAGSVASMIGGPAQAAAGEIGSVSKMLTILNFGDEPSHTPGVKDMAVANELAGKVLDRAARKVGETVGKAFGAKGPGGNLAAGLIDEDPSDPIAFDDGAGSGAGEERIFEFRLRKNIRPKVLRLLDRDVQGAHNWVGVAQRDAITPDMDLGVGLSVGLGGPKVQSHGTLAFDIDSPAIPPSVLRQELYQVDASLRSYTKKDQRVQRELERARVDYLEACGQSDSRRLGAGYRFRIDGHPVGSLNREYTITALDSDGVHPDFATEGQPVYRNRFRCIPSHTAPRPRRSKKQPKLGLEVAKVVALEGKLVAPYLETNACGYVRIRFRWDISDDKGRPRGSLSYGDEERHTIWVPVVQPWAGDGYGAQFLPREGMEVLVGFLEHQDNRPIILGCIYSGENALPFPDDVEHQKVGIRSRTIPDDGTHSEISIDARRNGQRMIFHAARDLDEEVTQNRTSEVGRDSSTTVGRNVTLVAGKDLLERINGDHSYSVSGSSAEQVNESKSEHVANNYELSVGESFATEAGSHSTTVRGDLSLVVRGSRSVVIGEPGLKTVDDRHIYGIGSIGADEALHFRADKEIKFTVGNDDTVLTMTPAGATLSAKNITLQARSRTVVMGPGPTLTLDKRATLFAKNVTLASTTASLDLGTTAVLYGTKLDFKSGGGQSPGARIPSLPPGTKLFQVRLADEEGQAIVGKPYHLLFGDERLQGTTGGDGLVSEAIPEDVARCEIIIWPETYPEGPRHHHIFDLRELPPHDTPAGLRSRLHALGYDVGVGEANLEERMTIAIMRFQQDHKESHQLSVTGDVDQPTIEAIRAVFGS